MDYRGRFLEKNRKAVRWLHIRSSRRGAILWIGVIVAVFGLYQSVRVFSILPNKVQADLVGIDKYYWIWAGLQNGIPIWDPYYQVADDPPPASPTTTPFIPMLVRQANCSLTREVFDGSFSLQPQYTYPGYQDFLHQSSGLTTTPDLWPGACAQPATGVASQQIETVATQNNGNVVLAAINVARNFPAADGQNVVVAVINTTNSQALSQTTYPAVSTNYLTTTLAVADVNRDGINDILVASLLNGASGAAGEISVLLGKSDGTFQTAMSTPINLAATNVTLDDMNGDGKLDLVVTGVASPGVAVLLGKGDGTFGAEIDGPSGSNGLAAITADLNGDGKKDVATSSGQILLGKGDGTLTLGAGSLLTVAPTGGDPAPGRGIAAADFNKDGKIDLAVTNRLTATADIYLGNGDGTFIYKSSFASLYGLRSIQTTDINGDGIADLFVGSTSGGVFLTDAGTSGAFESALGNGDGSFRSGGDAYLANNPAPQSATVYDLADFDGDGKGDIVSSDAGLASGMPQLRVRQGLGNGKFADLATTPINTTGVAALVAADFNGDAKQDVAFGGASTVSVAAGKGDGTFAAQTDYPSSGQVTALEVADLNGDGKADIVFLSLGASQNAIGELLNNGVGTFQAAKQIDAQANMAAFAVADVNGDGKLDVVATASNIVSQSAGNLLVYLGNGDGTFQRPSSVTAGLYPGALAIADMNNDGHPDAVVYTADVNGTPLLDILLGNGDGTFKAPTSFQLPQNGVTSIAVGDLNSDKKPDVVLTACCGLANAMVALGNGDGTISVGGPLYNGISSNLIKLADVNGDGVPDLLLTSGTTNPSAVEVLLSSAIQTASYPTVTAITPSASSITVGQSVTFTVQVTSPEGNAPPSGSVTFSDGTTVLTTQTLSATGSATFTTSSLSVGTHPVTAAYVGNTTFAASTSAVVTVTVSASTLVATTTTLTATPTSIAAGGNLALSATVTAASSSATPTGTVTFSQGSTQLGTGTLTSSGQATYSTSTLAVGTDSITAAYAGNASFAASTSPPVSVTVTAAPANFSISLSPASGSVSPGSSATTTISITPSGGFNGAVSFACSGLPANSTCSAASATPNGTSVATSTLTINTNAKSSAMLQKIVPEAPRSGVSASFALLSCSGLFGLAFFQLRKKEPTAGRQFLCVLALLCGLTGVLGGCGGGSGGGSATTPAGSYSLTVTATSGSDVHSATYSLTVR